MTSTLDNALFLSRDDCLIAITQCLLSFHFSFSFISIAQNNTTIVAQSAVQK